MIKPYDDYKNTNIPWVDKIPSHWSVLRNKNVLFEQKGLVGDNATDYTLLSLTLNGVIARDMESGKGKFPKEFNSYKIVIENNIIFCLFDIDETPRTVGLSKLNGMITGAYDVFEVKNINRDYLYYYYLSVDNAKDMKPLYTGLRKVIGVPKFLGTKLPVPPQEEQDKIVKYLDWQISNINSLVNSKKKQIELLKEQKKAVINKAVTKGLDDTVPMKESGIEWLGKIPEHWKVIKLTKLLTEKTEKNKPNLQLLSVVREKGIIIRNVENKEENHNFIPEDLKGYKVVNKNQFVMNKMKAWQGSYGVSLYNGIVSPAYYVFDIVFKNLNFFHAAIRSKIYVNFFAQASDGIRVGQWDLSKQKMKNIPFFVPPEGEQKEIVSYINQTISKIDTVIKAAEEEIKFISEYKISLISSVVTGKIDVRDIKIPEFEVVEEIIVDNELDNSDVMEEVING